MIARHSEGRVEVKESFFVEQLKQKTHGRQNKKIAPETKVMPFPIYVTDHWVLLVSV